MPAPPSLSILLMTPSPLGGTSPPTDSSSVASPVVFLGLAPTPATHDARDARDPGLRGPAVASAGRVGSQANSPRVGFAAGTRRNSCNWSDSTDSSSARSRGLRLKGTTAPCKMVPRQRLPHLLAPLRRHPSLQAQPLPLRRQGQH